MNNRELFVSATMLMQRILHETFKEFAGPGFALARFEPFSKLSKKVIEWYDKYPDQDSEAFFHPAEMKFAHSLDRLPFRWVVYRFQEQDSYIFALYLELENVDQEAANILRKLVPVYIKAFAIAELMEHFDPIPFSEMEQIVELRDRYIKSFGRTKLMNHPDDSHSIIFRLPTH